MSAVIKSRAVLLLDKIASKKALWETFFKILGRVMSDIKF